MENLQRLLLSELGIPAWQLGLLVGLISFFALTHRVRAGLIATYLLTLYWNFYVFRAHLFSVAGGDFLALAVFILFGFLLAGLSLYTFFSFRESSYLPGLAGLEIGRLRKTLLKRIDQMESAVLRAETRTIHEIQQFEELKQKIETRIGPLENQVQKMDEVFGQRESAVQGLERGLLTQLHDLENQLGRKEELLQSRDQEIQGLRSEMEEQSLKLQFRLQEEEERIRRESSWKAAEENLHAAIHDLEAQLTKKEALLLARNLEIRDLRLEVEEREQQPAHSGAPEFLSPDSEVRLSSFQALLEEQEESFARRTASYKEVVESLTSRINDLESQLKEREALPNVHLARSTD